MLRIFFDNTELNSDDIISFSQTVKPFNNSFKAGVTVCRQFDLEILKGGKIKLGEDDIGFYAATNEGGENTANVGIDVNGIYYSKETIINKINIGIDSQGVYATDEPQVEFSLPEKVRIYEDNLLYATLVVDSCDDNDKRSISLTLTDQMVRFNKTLTYENKTVKQILNQICVSHGIELVTQSFYMADQTISWGSGEVSERDFIGYVAEVNGGYAYINNEGNLCIEPYSNVSKGNIDLAKCSDITVGNHHKFGRVYVELAEATQYYPDKSNLDTLYLDPNNILLSDSGNYTIQEIIKHIHGVINGFEFYDVSVEKCPILPGIRACQLITIDKYPTLVTIEWDYNLSFFGGYELQLDSNLQEETTVSDTAMLAKLKKIKIQVDREIGQISQQITDVNKSMATVSKKADNASLVAGSAKDTADSANAKADSANTKADEVAGVVNNLGQTVADNSGKINDASNQGNNNAVQIETLITRMSELIQTSDAIALTVSKIETASGDNSKVLSSLQTSFKVQADGAYISQGKEGSYTKITDKGMDIYAEGVRAAYARVDGFYASDYITNGWHMMTSNGNNSFNFIRKDFK